MSEAEKTLGQSMLDDLAALGREERALVRGFVEGVRAAASANEQKEEN